MVTLPAALQHASKDIKHPLMHLDKCEMFLRTKHSQSLSANGT